MAPFQPLPGATVDDQFNGLYRFNTPTSASFVFVPWRRIHHFFLEEYLLPTSVRYKGPIGPLKHIRRFKLPSGRMTKRRCRPLEAVSIIFRRNQIWLVLYSLWGSHPIWSRMKKQFLDDQMTHRHNLKFIRNVAIYELRRQQPIWDPILRTRTT